MVQEAAHPEVHIIWGAAIDDNLEDEVRLSIIATGFDTEPPTKPGEPARKVTAPAANVVGDKAFTDAKEKAEGAEEAASDKEKSIDDDIQILIDMFNKRH